MKEMIERIATGKSDFQFSLKRFIKFEPLTSDPPSPTAFQFSLKRFWRAGDKMLARHEVTFNSLLRDSRRRSRG